MKEKKKKQNKKNKKIKKIKNKKIKYKINPPKNSNSKIPIIDYHRLQNAAF